MKWLRKLISWFKTKRALINLYAEYITYTAGVNRALIMMQNDRNILIDEYETVIKALTIHNGGKVKLSNDMLSVASADTSLKCIYDRKPDGLLIRIDKEVEQTNANQQ